MPTAVTRLSWAESKHITKRTSVPKDFCEEAELTDEDSLVWEWTKGGKEARVRKA